MWQIIAIISQSLIDDKAKEDVLLGRGDVGAVLYEFIDIHVAKNEEVEHGHYRFFLLLRDKSSKVQQTEQ